MQDLGRMVFRPLPRKVIGGEKKREGVLSGRIVQIASNPFVCAEYPLTDVLSTFDENVFENGKVILQIEHLRYTCRDKSHTCEYKRKINRTLALHMQGQVPYMRIQA